MSDPNTLSPEYRALVESGSRVQTAKIKLDTIRVFIVRALRDANLDLPAHLVQALAMEEQAAAEFVRAAALVDVVVTPTVH